MQLAPNILAIDYGDVRVGLAYADGETRMSRPLQTISNEPSLLELLRKIIDEKEIGLIVLGLPRNLDGDDTQQTEVVRAFADFLKNNLGLEIILQDEAGTSKRAEEQLQLAGRIYAKGDIDALAASYILDDYLMEAAK